MNSINSTPEPYDRQLGKGKSAATLAEEILQHLKQAVPYGTTFIHEIPMGVSKEVEAQLQQAFERWANSWIAPLCRAIIAKQTP